MSRRQTNRIRGPTSALSSFLREKGIVANNLNPYARAVDQRSAVADAVENQQQPQTLAVEPNAQEEVEEVLEPEMQPQASSSKSKKKRRRNDGSDDEDAFQLARSNHSKKNTTRGVQFCANCNRRFFNPASSLCDACSQISKKGAISVQPTKKKRKAVNATLLSDSTVAFPSLKELCINFVAENVCEY